MNDQDLVRYSRHILLDEIGVEGPEGAHRLRHVEPVRVPAARNMDADQVLPLGARLGERLPGTSAQGEGAGRACDARCGVPEEPSPVQVDQLAFSGSHASFSGGSISWIV